MIQHSSELDGRTPLVGVFAWEAARVTGSAYFG